MVSPKARLMVSWTTERRALGSRGERSNSTRISSRARPLGSSGSGARTGDKVRTNPQIQPELLGLAKAIPGATRGPLHLVLNRKPPAKPIRVGRQTEPVLQTRRAESERRPHATWSNRAVHSRPCGPRQAELEQAVQGAIPPQDLRWRWNRRFNHHWGTSLFLDHSLRRYRRSDLR